MISAAVDQPFSGQSAYTRGVLGPITPEWYPWLWEWMQEAPEANFDDSGPSSLFGLTRQLEARIDAGEQVSGVSGHDGPAGVIGFQPGRVGALRGICFRRAVHGTGLAGAALDLLLAGWAREGTRKVQAQYFADNRRVRAFLKRAGFVDEGYLRAQTVRGGHPLDVWLVARFL